MPTVQYSPLPHNKIPLFIAVIADTHVPDRMPNLPAKIISILHQTKPDYIFHAGDISLQSALSELDSIAPTLAVVGNRDLTMNLNLPAIRRILIGNLKVILTHGQGSLIRYISDKMKYYRRGYDFDRYRCYFEKDFPEADLVIFGHTHSPVNTAVKGRRYFNPGASYPCKSNHFKARIGWIEFTGLGKYKTRYIYLE